MSRLWQVARPKAGYTPNDHMCQIRTSSRRIHDLLQAPCEADREVAGHRKAQTQKGKRQWSLTRKPCAKARSYCEENPTTSKRFCCRARITQARFQIA